ncbi:MAG: VWA domain-containing protein, partial [Spirochaetaceae bacterium]|nr:VWA domain-containing protein [Spirochaetaceae bacterium]
MKRFYIGGLLFLLFLFSVYPQQGAASTGTADIIVLLDNSGTMFPFFDTINNAVLEDITAHFIRRGDTFHLITFNTTPVTEIVQQISSEMDIRRIISRFRLLYPLGVYSDFLSAIKFTQRYVNSLTTDSQKIVVIISDGILNPPSASPYYQVSPEEAEGEIISSVSRMHRDGIQIYFIKAPFPEGVKIRNLGKSTEEEVPQPEISSGTEIPAAEEPVTETKTEPPGPEPVQDGEDTEPDFFEYATTLDQIPSVVTDTLPETGEAPSFTETTLLLPEITFREALGRQFYTFRLPLRITNNADRRLRLQLDRIIINSENVLEKTL